MPFLYCKCNGAECFWNEYFIFWILWNIIFSFVELNSFKIKKRKILHWIKTCMMFFSNQQHTSILFQFTSYKIGVSELRCSYNGICCPNNWTNRKRLDSSGSDVERELYSFRCLQHWNRSLSKVSFCNLLLTSLFLYQFVSE